MAISDHNLQDPFGGYSVGPIGGARAVVPSDSSNLPDGPCRAIWVGVSGDVEVILAGDSSAIVFGSVPANTIIPLACRRILDTNTTATTILALY